MPPVIRLHRSWPEQVLDMLLDAWRQAARVSRRADALERMDRRTLADIGLDAAQIDAIKAEASPLAQLTRSHVVSPLIRD